MPRLDIYVNKPNMSLLREEPSMSGLINSLLAAHYEKHRGEDLEKLRTELKQAKDKKFQESIKEKEIGRASCRERE